MKLHGGALGSKLAPHLPRLTFLLCLAAVPLAPLLGQRFYVDEAALLAGMVAPTFAPPLTEWHGGTDVDALANELARLNLDPAVHTTWHGANCSCKAVSAVAYGRRADGLEAVLLSTRLGGSSAVGEARSVALLLALGKQLANATWLSKDVALLFAPCCPCALTAADAECAAAPMRSLLAGLTLNTLTGAGVEHVDALPATGQLARVGVLRQALSLSISGAGAPVAMRALLVGRDGQLPNLDLYAAVWRLAQRSELRVPLLLHEPRLASVAEALGPTRRLLHFAASVALGREEGDHAEAMRAGADALELRGVTRSELGSSGGGGGGGSGGSGSGSRGGGGSGAWRPLSTAQLVWLLELTVRCWSTLGEALHHSHYTYLPLSADVFLPFKHAGPLLHLPPLLLLLLAAALHAARAPAGSEAAEEEEEVVVEEETEAHEAQEVQGEAPSVAEGDARAAAPSVASTSLALQLVVAPRRVQPWERYAPAVAAQLALHGVGAAVAVLPRLGTPPVACIACAQLAWGAAVALLCRAIRGSAADGLSCGDGLCAAARLSASACVAAAIASLLVTAHCLALGWLTSLGLAGLAAVALPPPPPPLPPPLPPPPGTAAPTARSSLGRLGAVAVLLAFSPAGLLLLFCCASGWPALDPLGYDGGEATAWSFVTPYAIACVCCLPLATSAAAARACALVGSGAVAHAHGD